MVRSLRWSIKMKFMSSRGEQVLSGGNVAAVIVRVGATVRKPSTQSTPAIEALLEHLAALGFSAAPRTLGRDDLGRHVLEFVPGQMADTLPSLTVAELLRLGGLIRELHDALARFRPPASARWQVAIPPDDDELVCHNDLAPWNLVRDGDRWVFIDWDGAGPGTRLWDLGYAAQTFVPLQAGGDATLDGPRLRVLADGYGLDECQRRAFPTAIAAHTRGMYELLRASSGTGKQPWGRLYAEGHGEHWRRAAEYVEAHGEHWTASLLD
jgi:Ser/Thr protein kinase RdoA (MazF antagonist)